MTVEQRVIKVTAEVLKQAPGEITAKSSFKEDLGADSLDLVELVMGLEEEFSTPEHKVEIPEGEVDKITTVQNAVDYLKGAGVED